MADGEEERVVFHEPPSDPDTLLLRDDSPVPEDFLERSEEDVIEEKPEHDLGDEEPEPADPEGGPHRQQGDDLPWGRRWSRDRSEESTREKSVDSRDSATRERDLRYAEERKRDRDRGRREEVVLYRNSDSESAPKNSGSEHSDSDSGQSETTEEGELKSPKRSRKRSPLSVPAIIDETTTSWEALPQIAVAEPQSSVEETECGEEKEIQQEPAKALLISKDDTSETEPDTELTCNSYAARKGSEAPGGKESDDNDFKASRNGAKRLPVV